MVFKDLDGLVPQPVTLARERQVALTDTADRVVAEALRSYEQYIANHRQVDARLWKHVKSREKVHVYRTRRADAKKSLELVHARQVSRPRLLSNETVERQQRQAHAAGRPHGFTPDDEDDGKETVFEFLEKTKRFEDPAWSGQRGMCEALHRDDYY